MSGGEQRLKADASRRRVPLHKSLIDLGLLELVELRRSGGQARIFTHLERGQTKGTLSEVFSKRFTHYRKSCGLYDERRDFHALRTEFQTRLTRAEVPEHSRKALMGHAMSDITHGHYYRAGDTVEMLKRYVDRIDIDTSGVLRPTFAPT